MVERPLTVRNSLARGTPGRLNRRAMNDDRLVKISRRLSLHLRHRPGALGLTLEPGGWVSVESLLSALARHGLRVTRTELDQVVADNDKQRFAFDETGTRIRANQGHSVPVDLELTVEAPPPVLYHGTVAQSLPGIEHDGLRPMRRHHVHLSSTHDTARTVGARRGTPIVLTVDAAAMAADGYEFYISANGVWLTAEVPSRYLSRPAS